MVADIAAGRLRSRPHPPSTDADLGIVRRVSFLFVLLAVLVIVGIGYAALRFAGEDPLED